MILLTLCFVIWGILAVQEVHIIPHSHCDPGYRKTTVEYFYESVKEILDNTIEYLSEHENAKNIWVETIYLKMWWDQAETHQQNELLRLIHDTKQMEIVMGGFVMNDQATVTYISSINQMTHGHIWQMQNTNSKPVEGFTIDPFGETVLQAYLYKKMGFKYHIINRIPIEIKVADRTKKTLEFNWEFNPSQKKKKKNENSDDSSSLFTHIMYQHYDPPDPSLFSFWSPAAVPVTPTSVDAFATVLFKNCLERSKAFLSTEDLFIPFGGDFAYTCPKKIYGNMTYLMDYMNSNTNYNSTFHFKYSTPSDYLDNLFKSSKKKSGSDIIFPKIDIDDYFVYDSESDRYWSGYFTSQPLLKLRAREGERIERTADQIHALTKLYVHDKPDLDQDLDKIYFLRSKNGEIQHHDAITGTCKAHTAVYYDLNMEEAFLSTQDVIETSLSMLVSEELVESYGKYLQWSKSGYKYMISEEYVKDGDKIGIILYNSLGWTRDGQAIPIHFYQEEEKDCFDVTVTDKTGKIKYTTSEVLPIYGDKRQKKFLFDAPPISPMGYSLFVVNINSCSHGSSTSSSTKTKEKSNDDLFIENDFYKLYFNKETNKLEQMENKKSGIKQSFSLDHFMYESKVNYAHQGDDSDAYAFSPKSNTPEEITKKVEILEHHKTELYEEITQKFSDYVIITICLYKTANFFEVKYQKLGEVPRNREIVVKLKSEINNNKVLYHDALALKMMKKEYKGENETKYFIQANYYPSQWKGFIKDEKSQLIMLENKPQGISSPGNGELEIMIHRRPSGDILEIPEFPYLDDTYTMKENFKMRFILDEVSDRVEDEMIKQSYYLNYPLDFFSFNSDKLWRNKDLFNQFKIEDSFSFFKENMELPKQLHLLSLKRIKDVNENSNDFMFRVNNIYDGAEETQKIEVDQIFKQPFSFIQEYSLSYMYSKEEQLKNTEVSIDPLDFVTYKINF